MIIRDIDAESEHSSRGCFCNYRNKNHAPFGQVPYKPGLFLAVLSHPVVELPIRFYIFSQLQSASVFDSKHCMHPPDAGPTISMYKGR